MRPTRSAAPSPSPPRPPAQRRCPATAAPAAPALRAPRRAGARAARRPRRAPPPAPPGRRGARRRRRGSPRPGASARRRSRRARRTRPSARRRRATRRGAVPAGASVLGLRGGDVQQRLGRAAAGGERLGAHEMARPLHERRGERAGLALGLRVPRRRGPRRRVGGRACSDGEDGREVEGVLVGGLDAVEHGQDRVARLVWAPAPERELGPRDGQRPRPHRPQRVLLRALGLIESVSRFVEAPAQGVEQRAPGQRGPGRDPADRRVDRDGQRGVGFVPAPQPQQAQPLV